MLIFSGNSVENTAGIMFYQYWAFFSPVELTYKIKHHSPPDGCPRARRYLYYPGKQADPPLPLDGGLGEGQKPCSRSLTRQMALERWSGLEAVPLPRPAKMSVAQENCLPIVSTLFAHCFGFWRIAHEPITSSAALINLTGRGWYQVHSMSCPRYLIKSTFDIIPS